MDLRRKDRIRRRGFIKRRRVEPVAAKETGVKRPVDLKDYGVGSSGPRRKPFW